MRKIGLILITILIQQIGISQTKNEIDDLLYKIGNEVINSKEIILNENSKKILNYKEKSVNLLTEFYSDNSETRIFSDCLERKITKGEIAIILTDRIKKLMPYYQLTGIENCLLTFCENNGNLIEYYLAAIKRDGIERFKQRYIEWNATTKEFKEYQKKCTTNKRKSERLLKKASKNKILKLITNDYWKRNGNEIIYNFWFEKDLGGVFELEMQENGDLMVIDDHTIFKITKIDGEYIFECRTPYSHWFSKLKYLSKTKMILEINENEIEYHKIEIEK